MARRILGTGPKDDSIHLSGLIYLTQACARRVCDMRAEHGSLI